MEVNFTRDGLKIKLGSQIPEVIVLEAAKVHVLRSSAEEEFLMHDDLDDDYLMHDDNEEDYILI